MVAVVGVGEDAHMHLRVILDVSGAIPEGPPEGKNFSPDL